MQLDKRLSFEEAANMLKAIRAYAQQHGQRVGQAMVNYMHPDLVAPTVFYGSEDIAISWFYKVMVDGNGVGIQACVETALAGLSNRQDFLCRDQEIDLGGHFLYEVQDHAGDVLERNSPIDYQSLEFSIFRRISDSQAVRVYRYGERKDEWQGKIGALVTFTDTGPTVLNLEKVTETCH